MTSTTKKFDFQNREGQTLSGRLEVPASKPRAFALLAHCFTCSKDFIAASRISRKLSENGIAVLRFDFTGLGNSQGDFSNTNFSSNVADLLSACEALSQSFQAPEILIGHSLGGAAVLKASLSLSEVKSVVTIGAPSDIHHVTHLFEPDLEKINSQGAAEVHLAGRKFTIKKQFIDDIEEHSLLKGLSEAKKSFLIMHSPTDNTVSIDHASKIFLAAKHPKSFVSLDGSDHLLTKAKDAEYAAEVISAWLTRLFPHQEPTSKRPTLSAQVEAHSRPAHKFTQDIYSKNHHLVADEPEKVQGDDLGMNPYELLLSSLGACTAMTIKMYAERKKIKIDELRVELNHEKKYSEDCEECLESPKWLDHVTKKIHLSGEMTEAQKKRILEIAERCPVNLTLMSVVDVRTLED